MADLSQYLAGYSYYVGMPIGGELRINAGNATLIEIDGAQFGRGTIPESAINDPSLLTMYNTSADLVPTSVNGGITYTNLDFRNFVPDYSFSSFIGANAQTAIEVASDGKFVETGFYGNGIQVGDSFRGGLVGNPNTAGLLVSTSDDGRMFIVTNNTGKWHVFGSSQINRSYYSTDNGDNWFTSNISSPYGDKPYSGVAVREGTDIILAIVSTDANNRSIFRTTDWGENWLEVGSSAGDEVAVWYSGSGDTWYALRNNSNVLRRSNNNGETWFNNGTIPFTVDNQNTNRIITRAVVKNGHTYVYNGGDLYHTSGALSALSLVDTSVNGFGVDDNGLCLFQKRAFNNEACKVYTSNQGAAPVLRNQITPSHGITTIDVDIKYRNGAWHHPAGNGTLTDAELAAGDSWRFPIAVAEGGNSAPKICYKNEVTGTTIIVYHGNNYLRTTDNFATATLRGFNLDTSQGDSDQQCMEAIDLASDDAGNWVVLFNDSLDGYISTDDGLTWTKFTHGATNPRGLAWGRQNQHFAVLDRFGNLRLTTNNFSAISTVSTSDTNLSINDLGYVNGGYAWFTRDGSNNTTLVTRRVDNTGSTLTRSLGNTVNLNRDKFIEGKGARLVTGTFDCANVSPDTTTAFTFNFGDNTNSPTRAVIRSEFILQQTAASNAYVYTNGFVFGYNVNGVEVFVPSVEIASADSFTYYKIGNPV